MKRVRTSMWAVCAPAKSADATTARKSVTTSTRFGPNLSRAWPTNSCEPASAPRKAEVIMPMVAGSS